MVITLKPLWINTVVNEISYSKQSVSTTRLHRVKRLQMVFLKRQTYSTTVRSFLTPELSKAELVEELPIDWSRTTKELSSFSFINVRVGLF